MLTFTNVTLRRSSKILFEDVSFTIHKDQKVGLVGANGAGKTSLFKLILNELESDQGGVEKPENLRISHLAQEVAGTDEIAIDYVLGGDVELEKIQKKIKEAETNQEFEKVGNLYSEFDAMDGYSSKARAEQLMVGLGFKEEEFNKSLKDFSGGWRVRLNLARTLMKPSDILLLDEPTNHLDLDAILWLSNWIKSYQGAILLISHDREFLDDCVNNIAYLYAKSIDLFTGNYSAFEIRKAARLAEQEANYNKQQREIAHMQSFVRRFKAKATKAKQAQSRVKALERMEIIAQAHVDSPFSFSIKSDEKISNPLLVLENAGLGYESVILKNINLSLHPGDRFGLLGHNGAGKSTLIKSLIGELKLIQGEKKPGTHLKMGYFSQHQVDDLDINLSAFEHIKKLDSTKSETEIRSFLGGFDFKNDKVKQPINIFSGGEKARLALAKIAYLKPNLLLLDEPTNHLDIDMRHALTIALQSFEGAILLISHDRHLLANSVDNFYLLHDGKLNEFQGDLEDYRNQILKVGGEKKSKQKITPKSESDKEISKSLKLDLQQNEKRSKRLIKKLLETEELLSLPDAFNSKENDFHDLLRSQVELKAEIQQTEDEWLDLTDQIENKK